MKHFTIEAGPATPMEVRCSRLATSTPALSR